LYKENMRRFSIKPSSISFNPFIKLTDKHGDTKGHTNGSDDSLFQSSPKSKAIFKISL
jgi:hypothetical protein